MADQRTAIYRHFDADGLLLYVGISVNPFARTAQHSKASEWFSRVAEIKLDWHVTRDDAEKAETAAIIGEKPVFNSTWSGGLSRTDRMFLQGALSLSDFTRVICIARGPHNMFHARAARYGVSKSSIVFGEASLERAIKSVRPNTDLIVCLGRLKPDARLEEMASERNVFIATDNNLSDWLGRREPGDVKPPAGLII